MKHKKARKLFVIFLTSLSLIGCCNFNQLPPNNDSSSLANNETSPTTDHILTSVTSRSGLAFTQYGGTENGCYEVRRNPNGTGNILYTDYSSRNTVFLSSQVSSTHSDETDESWLDSVIGGVSIFSAENKVYIIKRGKTEFLDTMGELGRSYLLQIDQNGMNRKEWLFLEV